MSRNRRKKLKGLPLFQPEIPPKGALLRIELASGINEYSLREENAERLFENPDVKAVTFIGKPKNFSREEIMNMPANSIVRIQYEKGLENARRAVLEAQQEEQELKRAQQQREQEARIAQQREAMKPENVLGVKPNERLGKVEYRLTEEGRKVRLSEYDYSVTGARVIELYKKGLISGVRVTGTRG